MTNAESQFSMDYIAWGEQLKERGNLFNQQSMNVVGPNFEIPDYPERSSGASEPQGSDIHPHLFGQDKTKGGYGPFYAVPPFPSQPGFLPSTSGGQGMSLEEQEHPALFGQNQLHGGYGPIYTVPAYPFPHGQNPPIQTMPHPSWQQSQNQGAWGNQPLHGGYFVPIYCPAHWPPFSPQGN